MQQKNQVSVIKVCPDRKRCNRFYPFIIAYFNAEIMTIKMMYHNICKIKRKSLNIAKMAYAKNGKKAKWSRFFEGLEIFI